MSEIAIQVENLSKLYHINHLKERDDTLRDALVNAIRHRANRKTKGSDYIDHIWALKEVSFDVKQGEVLGIIGRNGAGKSTLLKILSQITEPTRGKAVINGRVGSLLEVGAGFHPELTGRENIYLNGIILGMRRSEIVRKFDEIVEFAEIKQFLDTPVKRYSSGMYVRLAFAIAAHLETEILFVDEVLAVGDTEFQRRCLGKMDDISGEGRTVLFVSHNMNVIQRLCPQTILLQQGELVTKGKTSEVITEYISSRYRDETPETWNSIPSSEVAARQGAYFSAYWYRGGNAASGMYPFPDSQLEVRLRIYSDAPRDISSLAVSIFDKNGTKLVNADTLSLGRIVHLAKGDNEVQFIIDPLHLNPGFYNASLWMANPPSTVFEHIDQAFTIEVVDVDELNLGRRPGADGSVTCDFSLHQVSVN